RKADTGFRKRSCSNKKEIEWDDDSKKSHPALMFDPSWFWALFTIIAAAAQTVRNATQRGLTASLGTVGATHVRFLFGFPFALVFLAAVMVALDQRLPLPPLV